MPFQKTIRNTLPELLDRAKQMRGEPTPAEAKLWEQLQNRQLGGLRFRRQHPVNAYILDFWCPACKLVVELDGSAHDTPQAKEHDAARQEHLQSYGYTILRFSNERVTNELPVVLNEILNAANLAHRSE